MSALAAPRLPGGPSGRSLTPAQVDDLVARAKDGDIAAFEQLVVETSPACYQLAYRLVGNEHDARDVVQEVYLRAYRGLKRFRGESSVTSWLYRITANCASRLLDRRRRATAGELGEEAAGLVEQRPDRDPELAASAADDRQRLIEALEELPDALRVVVVLRDIYDMPHREIARELGITQSAAKVRLHRARRLLRDRIFPSRRAALQPAGGVTEPADDREATR